MAQDRERGHGGPDPRRRQPLPRLAGYAIGHARGRYFRRLCLFEFAPGDERQIESQIKLQTFRHMRQLIESFASENSEGAPPDEQPPRKTLTEAQKKMLIAECQAGEEWKETGKETGLTEEQVRMCHRLWSLTREGFTPEQAMEIIIKEEEEDTER